ncbi:MAG: LLM class flavin-dependent oxidoreductase [Streptosporangiales bacterium]|nr:LLM class flavin-dependent oxidoreductase [Streptosporangiales bacterium]
MRFGISIPQLTTTNAFDPVAFRTYLTRAEELGFDSAWTMEQVLGATPFLAANEVLSHAAAVTERLRLGCVVYVAALHNPVHLAKTLSTLDQLSRGRLEAGLGVGAPRVQYSAYEVDPGTRVARLTEGLRLMKALWTQERVTFDGRFWQLDDAGMEPKPFQQPHPPVWFGASHPDALRRTARLADGFFGAGSSTTDQFVEQVPVVRRHLAEFDRDPAEFRIAKRVYIAVDDDADRARQRMDDALVAVYGEFGKRLSPVAVVGPPDICVRELERVREAGAELILVNPLFDYAEQLERLAADVLPRLA